MPRSDEHALENLIRRSEELIKTASAVSTPDTAGMAEAVPSFDLFEVYTEPSEDALLDITVSEDGMTATAGFHPPAGDGRPLTLDAVREELRAHGITTGVAWDVINGCMETCNEQRVPVSDTVIARGRPPVDEVPAYLVLSEALRGQQQKETQGVARVNYKELSLFTLVKKGDVLATRMPQRDGTEGMTVRGAPVPFAKAVSEHPAPGKNTEWQGETVLAKTDGKLQLSPISFSVEEVLEIRGDVDLSVGNIDFPGDVVIRGELRDGFVVKAGKSILCQRSIGAARVECKGDLVTNAGILGKERAVIRVGGTAEAKFIEGCSLDCGGPLRVRTSIINSTIHSGDRVEMGERGIIIGGIVKAANGVAAAQIGSERGPRTEIHCGLDFAVERKLIWIRDKNIALAFKLRELQSRMRTAPSTRSVLAPLQERIKAAIHGLNEAARTLVSKLERNDDADVSVQEVVFPGTYIEICHVSHFITKPRRFVAFRLDKGSGKVVEKKWENPREREAAAKKKP